MSKKSIVYYMTVKSDESSEMYLSLFEESEVNPFIKYDSELWDKTDYLPENAKQIRSEEETSEDTVKIITYYYTEEDISDDIKPVKICKNCIYYFSVMTTGGMRLSLCSNKNNVGIDTIEGKKLFSPCIKYNSLGNCKYYNEKDDERRTD